MTDMTTAELATRAFAQELERLESRGELELEEPDRAGRRGALLIAATSVWARHLDGLLEAEQVRELLGVRSRQAVHDLVRREGCCAYATAPVARCTLPTSSIGMVVRSRWWGT